MSNLGKWGFYILVYQLLMFLLPWLTEVTSRGKPNLARISVASGMFIPFLMPWLPLKEGYLEPSSMGL